MSVFDDEGQRMPEFQVSFLRFFMTMLKEKCIGNREDIEIIMPDGQRAYWSDEHWNWSYDPWGNEGEGE